MWMAAPIRGVMTSGAQTTSAVTDVSAERVFGAARIVISASLSFPSADHSPATEALLGFFSRANELDVCEVSFADAVAPIRSLFGRRSPASTGQPGSFFVSVPSDPAIRGAFGAVPASTLGLPVFAHHHSDVYLNSASNQLRLFRRMCHPAIEVVPSPQLAELAESTRTGRILVVDNACLMDEADCAELRSSPAPVVGDSRPIIVGYLGSLTVEHGALDMIEAFARLADSGLAIELHIAGSMVDLEVSAALLEVSGRHPHRVRHSEYPVEADQRCAWFNDIDIFVLPTTDRTDAQPIAIYEAAAAGCAVLAASIGAVPEQLESVGGYLMNSVERLDSQIKRVMSMNAGIAGIRATREQRMRKFTSHREKCLPGAAELLRLLIDPSQLESAINL